MSVKKSHKTDFSRKAISMLVWKYQILSKHFLFLFWCLKHVLGELGSSPGLSRAPEGAQRRRGRRRGRGRAGPGAAGAEGAGRGRRLGDPRLTIPAGAFLGAAVLHPRPLGSQDQAGGGGGSETLSLPGRI